MAFKSAKLLNKKSALLVKMDFFIFCGLILILFFWNTSIPSPIKLTADKAIYKPGEEVYICIKNISSKILRDSITLTIKDEKGKVIDELVIMLGWSPLKPGETIEHKWNQKGRTDGYGEVSKGRYILFASGEGYKIFKEIEIRS